MVFRVLKVLVLVVALLAVAGAVVYYLPDGQVRDLAGEMAARGQQQPAQVVEAAHFQGLPAPVRRWLEQAAPLGAPLPRLVRMEQTGSFRGEGSPRWMKLNATEWMSAGPEEFIWSARIWMLPFLWVQVRDYYHQGAGSFSGQLLGLIPLAEGTGTETDEASLVRWLAESPWVPGALLAGGAVRWSAVDQDHARAEITDGQVSAAGVFTFGPDGLPSRFDTPDRFRALPQGPQRQAWRGEYAHYRRFGPYLIPDQASAAWVGPKGPEPYARLAVTAAAFNQAVTAD